MTSLRTALRTLLLPVALLVGLVAGAHADTLIVDATGAPDADFTQIQPAIDAALPNDVILVRSGEYAGFSLAKPLRIVGHRVTEGGSIYAAGLVEVRDIPAGEVAVLAQFACDFLLIEDCAGTVFGDILGVSPPSNLPGTGAPAVITVVNSADVRFRQLGVNPGNGSGRHGLIVHASLVETEGAAIDGARGPAGTVEAPDGSDGGHGAIISGGGELRFHNGRMRGGQGGDALFSVSEPWHGGDGGDAFVVQAGGRLVVGGYIYTQVYGGWVGSGSLKQGGQANCPLEGAPGTGIRVERGASARVSSTIALLGGVAFCGEDGPLTVVEGDYESASPPDLNLHWEAGIPQVGIGTALEVNDVPGTLVILLVGIEPANVPLFKWKGNPVLVNLAFTTPILNLGAGGFASVPVGFPPSLPYGLPIIVQAAALRPDGSFQLSNSSTNVTSPPPPPSCDPIPCPPTR
jgi:hypothetical protein